MSASVFKQLCYMLVIAAMSGVFARRNKFGPVQSAFASRLLLYFVNPLLILRSFIVPYSSEKMQGLVLGAGVSVAMHLAFTVLAMVTVRRGGNMTRTRMQLAGLDRIAIVFTNCGFIGIPLINGVLGQDAVFFLMAYIATFNIYVWIFGAHEVSAPTGVLKVLTNPNVLSVIAGVSLFCLPAMLGMPGRTIPPQWLKPLDYISDTNTALSMILLGMLFAQFVASPHEHMGHTYRRAALVAVLRMAAASLVAVLITAAVWHLAPHTAMVHTVLMVCCIAALCPIGMTASTFACVFCGEGEEGGISPQAYSSLLVLSTSAVSVVTIPLFVRLAEALM